MRSLLSILAASLIVVTTAHADVLIGEEAPPLALQNAGDSTFTLATARTQPLVLIFTTRDLGDYSLAWHDSIHTRWPDVQIQSILDLSDVSSWLHGLARVRIRAKGSKAVIDWDGEASEQWRGDNREEVFLFGLSPDNVVRFVANGNAESERVAEVMAGLDRIREAMAQE